MIMPFIAFNLIFFVLLVNHKLLAWKPYINRVHHDDYLRHVHVDLII